MHQKAYTHLLLLTSHIQHLTSYILLLTSYFLHLTSLLLDKKVLLACGIEVAEVGISLTFQVKISKISIIEPQWNKHITRQYLQFMSGTCTVDVRYMSGIKADKYRTSTGHIADNDRRCIGTTRGLLYG